jgi:hypothetical protein
MSPFILSPVEAQHQYAILNEKVQPDGHSIPGQETPNGCHYSPELKHKLIFNYLQT